MALCGGALAQAPGPAPARREFSLEPDPRGDRPKGLAFVRGGAELAVLHELEPELRLFSARDGADLGAVPLGGRPTALAATSRGDLALVFDDESDTLVVVDVPARAVVARHTLPTARATAILVTPDERFAVVVPAGYPGTPDAVSVFDLVTRALSHSFLCELGTPTVRPAALSGDGRRLVLRGSGIAIFDLASGAVVWETDGERSGWVYGVWLDHTGDRALFMQSGSFGTGGVYELDVPTAHLTRRSVEVWIHDESVFVVSGGGRFLTWGAGVAPKWTDLVSGEERIIPVSLNGLAVGSNGDLALGVDRDTQQYAIVDLQRGRIVWTLPKSGPPPVLSAAGPGALVAALYPFTERVAVVDLDQLAPRVVFERSSGSGIEADGCALRALTSDGRVAVALCSFSQVVVATRLSDGAFLASLPTGPRASNLVVGRDVVAVSYGATGSCTGPDRIDLHTLSNAALDRSHTSAAGLTLVGVSDDDSRVYAVERDCTFQASLLVFDLLAPASEPPRRVPLPAGFPTTNALSSTGRYMLLYDSNTSSWQVIDTVLELVAATVPAGMYRSYAFSADERALFVASGNGASHALHEYTLDAGPPTLRVSHPVPASVGTLHELVHDGRGERLWCRGRGGVMCLELRTGAIRAVADSSEPFDVLLGLGPHAYVSHLGDWTRYFDDGQAVRIVDTLPEPGLNGQGVWAGSSLSRAVGQIVGFRGSPGGDNWVVLDLGVVEPRRFCPPTGPTSSGQVARLEVEGPRVAFGAEVTLAATGLPPGALALPFVGPRPAALGLPFGSTLCVGPTPLGLAAALDTAGPTGEARFRLAPGGLGGPGGPVVAHGTTWCFQVWFRDAGVLPRQGLTDALAVYFR